MDKQKKAPSKLDVAAAGPVKMYLKSERVQDQLERLPAWKLQPDGLAIESVRRFTNGQGAGAFAALACRLATKRRQPLKVSLTGTQVVLTLPGHPVRGCTGGLTAAVLNLADLIGS